MSEQQQQYSHATGAKKGVAGAFDVILGSLLVIFMAVPTEAVVAFAQHMNWKTLLYASLGPVVIALKRYLENYRKVQAKLTPTNDVAGPAASDDDGGPPW